MPEMFLSPQGRLLFFYVHPQNEAVHEGEFDRPDRVTSHDGLHVALVSEVLRALERIVEELSPVPASGYALHPGADDSADAIRRLSGEILSSVFFPLGEISVCRQPASSTPEGWVDEHFHFAEGRLQLFMTNVLSQMKPNPPRLDRIRRASAVETFNEDLLVEGLERLLGGEVNPALSAFDDQLLNFREAGCVPVDADWLRRGSDQDQVNDAHIYRLPGAVVGEPDRTVLLFFSDAVGGLLMQSTDRSLPAGTCPDGDWQPEEKAD